MKKILMILAFIFINMNVSQVIAAENNPYPWWEVQAVDTMKYSRDNSRQYLSNQKVAKQVVEQQVQQIAEVGATHIAIATPYDAEFLPILRLWVAEARKHNLKVWFRGNWSGWEGWFDYPKISRKEHLEKSKAFISNNPELFVDGDIFSACPECENGGPGDPRMNNDKAGHQKFLKDEHDAMLEAFEEIEKEVDVSYNSMNGDVAKLIMDPATTKALGGLVVVDHYVRTSQQLVTDVEKYAVQSQAEVFLGEFGAPIPDLQGNMTEKQQAEWLRETLQGLTEVTQLRGMSYWTNRGGSTAIWNDTGKPRQAVAVLAEFFKPVLVTGTVTNVDGVMLSEAVIVSKHKQAVSSADGSFTLPIIEETGEVEISKEGYLPQKIVFSKDAPSLGNIVLIEEKISWKTRITRYVRNLLEKF